VKALRFDRFGSLDALQVADVPAPALFNNDVLVRVRAAGMNPSDVKNVLGRFHETSLPRTPGRDFAGVVERGPEQWVGREVWGTFEGGADLVLDTTGYWVDAAVGAIAEYRALDAGSTEKAVFVMP